MGNFENSEQKMSKKQDITRRMTYVYNSYDTCVNVDKSVEIGDFQAKREIFFFFLTEPAMNQYCRKEK